MKRFNSLAPTRFPIGFVATAALAGMFTVGAPMIAPALVKSAIAEPPCDGCGGSRVDWLTLPAAYTHNEQTGMRVTQHTPIRNPTAPIDPTYQSSGYTHLRSTISFGQTADNYHRVETWGRPVRPYGEWQFPYRPYSTPYPNWGPPFAGLNLGYGSGYPGYRPGPGAGWNGSGPGIGAGPWNGSGQGRPGRSQNPAASPLNRFPMSPDSPYPVSP